MPAGKGYRAWGECGAPWRAQSEPAVCKNEACCQRVTAVPMEGPKGGRLGVHLGKQNNNWKKIYTHTHTHTLTHSLTKKSLKFLTKEWRIQQSRSSCADRAKHHLFTSLHLHYLWGTRERQKGKRETEREGGWGQHRGAKICMGAGSSGSQKKENGKGRKNESERVRNSLRKGGSWWEWEREKKLETR